MQFLHMVSFRSRGTRVSYLHVSMHSVFLFGLVLLSQSKISISDNKPKYFVLTFVLCGVIAGTVLAVIAIYIVRRYARSKEKLAQLASTSGDGQEASKDYQVCGSFRPAFVLNITLGHNILVDCN